MTQNTGNVEPLRILTVYAHPVEDAFGPSAALAHYARKGAQIV